MTKDASKRTTRTGATMSDAPRPGVDVDAVLDILAREYPDADCELNYTTPFELLVATILSAQATDERVNIVTGRLFPKYNEPKHFAAMTHEELGEKIRDLGLFRNKARQIVETSRILLEEYDGEVPRTREQLMELPGVGRKTANVVVSNVFDTPAIAVDTHVFRVANRIGLADAKNVDKTERQLMDVIPEALWTDTHHRIIHHGRQVCNARNPQCGVCPLLHHCHFAAQTDTEAPDAG